MLKLIDCTAIVGLAFAAANTAQAEPIARDAALLQALVIEGVSLDTPPEEAFEILTAAGYRADGVPTFRDWTRGSLNLVRGDFASPVGLSSMTIGRADGHLAMITQSLNKRGIDVASEIGAVQGHFGIAQDEPDCRVNNAGTGGSCQVSNAADPTMQTVKFTMTVQPTMILRSVSRPSELTKTLE